MLAMFKTCLITISLKNFRLFIFLLYVEIFSLILILRMILFKTSNDYSILLIILIVVACERAIGLSLLVYFSRGFSIEKKLQSKKCEGF